MSLIILEIAHFSICLFTALHFLFCESSVHVLCPFIQLSLNVFIISFRSSLYNKAINPILYGLQIFFLSVFAFSFELSVSFLFYMHIFFILIFCLRSFCTQLLSKVRKTLGGLAPSTSPLAIHPTKMKRQMSSMTFPCINAKSSLICLGLNTRAQNTLPAPINQDNFWPFRSQLQHYL